MRNVTRKNIRIIVLLTILIVTPSVYSTNIGDALVSISIEPVTQQKILIAANFLEQECQRFLDLVPELSPLQDDWLQSNVKENLDTVAASPEFNRRALHNILSRCVEGAKAAQKGIDIDTKMVGWMLIATRLQDMNLEYYVQQAQIPDLSKDKVQLKSLQLFVEPILENIVLPYMINNATSE